MMKFPLNLITLAALAMTALAVPAAAQDAKPTHSWPQLGVEASIPFANHRGIDNFQPDGDEGIWLQDIRDRWYYGKIIGPCNGLNFATAIGYETRGTSSFDKFSAILVEGQRCQLETLVTSDKPPSKKERDKARAQRRAAEKQQAETPPSN